MEGSSLCSLYLAIYRNSAVSRTAESSKLNKLAIGQRVGTLGHKTTVTVPNTLLAEDPERIDTIKPYFMPH